MKLLVVLSFFFVTSYAEEETTTWETYKLDYGKTYKNQFEEFNRAIIFYKNREIINRHNKLYEQEKVGYSMGVNQFSDMSFKEFKKTIGCTGPLSSTNTEQKKIAVDLNIPQTVDWRQKGKVTSVKNQQQCGSCWAFAAVATIESHHAIAGHNLTELSEQQILECDKVDKGCHGGWPHDAMDYVFKAKGLESEKDYPYKGRVTNPCNFDRSLIKANISGFYVNSTVNENHMAKLVARYGPITVAISVSPKFGRYRYGVFNDSTCNKYDIDHAVTIVGYGNGTEGPYWIVKNSWGTDWGDRGYIKMVRNMNMCHISDAIAMPFVRGKY